MSTFVVVRYYVLLFCCAVCCCFTAAGQIILSGKVTDSSARPLAQASVFVNGSTLGTTTGTDGTFSLNIGKGGFVELVVSHVGYEPLLYRFESGADNRQFIFRLQPKVETLRSVVVLSATMRKKWMQLFKDHFLGITQAGKSCRILNEDAVQFESGQRGAIIAFSDEPLVVVNKELGYRIHFQLVDFTYTEERTSFIGYSRFEELSGKTAQTKARIRRRYYAGSSAHFFRSLINNTYESEGFSVRLLKPVQMELPAPSVGPQPGSAAAVPKPVGKVVYSLPVPRDSILKKLDAGNETNYYQLKWVGRLQVQYSKNPATKAYLSRQVLLVGGMPKGITAFVELQEPMAVMDGSGSLADPLAISFGGFWIYEKLGSMLPADYGQQ